MADRYAEFDALTFERNEPGMLELVFDGPGLNAIAGEAHTQLSRVWRAFDDDPETKVVLVRGAGRAFSAGGSFDLTESLMADHETRARVLRETRDIFYGVIDCSKLVVSAMHGPAVGAALAVGLLA